MFANAKCIYEEWLECLSLKLHLTLDLNTERNCIVKKCYSLTSSSLIIHKKGVFVSVFYSTVLNWLTAEGIIRHRIWSISCVGCQKVFTKTTLTLSEHFLKKQYESVFTGIGQCDSICEESSTKSFMAPDEAACNLINSLRRYHSVVELHCGTCSLWSV